VLGLPYPTPLLARKPCSRQHDRPGPRASASRIYSPREVSATTPPRGHATPRPLAEPRRLTSRRALLYKPRRRKPPFPKRDASAPTTHSHTHKPSPPPPATQPRTHCTSPVRLSDPPPHTTTATTASHRGHGGDRFVL